MGDYVRWSPPYYEGAEETSRSALFLSLNRGKRSIRVDLKSEPGREVLLRLARDADVLLESFRPGVLDRLGVGYERLREEQPRLVYCAISGYGQDGPNSGPFRARHELPRPQRPAGADRRGDGPPVQAAGQIADLGGGALMAAVGILVALRERERSGEGQLVDCSMFDGALSWLAMVAAETFATGRAPRRGDSGLAGRYNCYRPYECADGYVTLGALEPKFWQAWCAGRRSPGSARARLRPPGLGVPRRGDRDLPRAHARAVARVRLRARLLPGAGAGARRGARLRAGRRPGDGGRAGPARGAAAGQAARGPDQARAAPRATRAARPARRSASTPTRYWRRPGSRPTRSRRCTRLERSPARRPACRARSLSSSGERPPCPPTGCSRCPSSPSARASAPARSSTTCARACSAPTTTCCARVATWRTTRRVSSSASGSSSACRRSASCRCG